MMMTNVGVGAGDNADSNDPRADPTTSGPGMLIEGIGDDDAASRGFRFSMTGGPVRMISRVADGDGDEPRGFRIPSATRGPVMLIFDVGAGDGAASRGLRMSS